MKFRDIKTLEHFLKEYGAVGGGGHGAVAKQNKANKSVADGPSKATQSPTVNGPTPNTDNKQPEFTKGKASQAKVGDIVNVDRKSSKVVSTVGQGSKPEALITKDEEGNLAEIPANQDIEYQSLDDIGDMEIEIPDKKSSTIQNYTQKFKKGAEIGNMLVNSKKNEGKLSKIASRKGKKLQIKDLKAKIKKLSRKRLKEANPKLFEINFNRQSVAREALDAPVKCGFEAETFWYNVEGSSNSEYVDDMSVSDVEYEFGDLPDSAYDYYNDWIREKAMDEYLPDIIDAWIEDNRDDDEFIRDFIDSDVGPTEDAVEEYKEEFAEEDPVEYENREEDGWDMDNWARDLINEEYEADYEDFLREIANEEDQLLDDAIVECEGDYDMDGYISDQYYSMSEFLDDFGFDYGRQTGDVEGVADEFHIWQKENSKFNWM